MLQYHLVILPAMKLYIFKLPRQLCVFLNWKMHCILHHPNATCDMNYQGVCVSSTFIKDCTINLCNSVAYMYAILLLSSWFLRTVYITNNLHTRNPGLCHKLSVSMHFYLKYVLLKLKRIILASITLKLFSLINMKEKRLFKKTLVTLKGHGLITLRYT